MKKLHTPTIAITLGDPGGIGPEVIAKSLKKIPNEKNTQYIIIGDFNIYKRYNPPQLKNCNFLDVSSLNLKNLRIGQPTKNGAQAALLYLQTAVNLIKTGQVNSLITAPVCKETINNQLNFTFEGHTEFLAKAFHVKEYEMMFVTPHLKTVILTRHIPLKKVAQAIHAQKVYAALTLTNFTLKKYFSISSPRIAVCGINPHAGEGGQIGNEETLHVLPAIKKAKKNHIKAEGPFAADTLFSPHVCNQYDAIIAMYHDQGLIPIKTLYFRKVVNLTIGLPFIRTSPAHGTAFNIAGQNKADPSSMVEAINLATQLTKLS